MRVECNVFTPKADSYGGNMISSHAFPHIHGYEEVHKCIDRAIGGMRIFKPGMKIEINIEEDTNYEG